MYYFNHDYGICVSSNDDNLNGVGGSSLRRHGIRPPRVVCDGGCTLQQRVCLALHLHVLTPATLHTLYEARLCNVKE